jgi:hypothetical protein
VFCAIDEQNGGFDIVFSPQFFEKHFCGRGCSGRKQPQVENFVRLWIRSGVQPELLIVDGDHRFGDSDLIRGLSLTGCRSAFCTQSWTAFRKRATPKLSRTEIVFKIDSTATCI